MLLAIAAKLFAPHLLGRLTARIQTAFSDSQVLDLPLSLYASNGCNWQAPLLLVVAPWVLGGLLLAWRLKPVTAHLAAAQAVHTLRHVVSTISAWRRLQAFATSVLITTGGFMIMPVSSVFTVNKLGIAVADLATIYLVTGL